MAHDIKKFGEDMLQSQLVSCTRDLNALINKVLERKTAPTKEEAAEGEGMMKYVEALLAEIQVRNVREKKKIANRSMAKTRARAEAKAKA